MGNSDKFDLEEIASKVKLALHDPLGKGIEGLKYQIKHGAQVIAEGVTDAEGKVAAFASKVGAELTLHVERFTTNEMKHVRSFVPTAKQYSAKVLSAKVKHEVPLKKDKDAPGDYKRKTYTIKKGDTLGAIAKANGTTAQALATLNGMKVEDTIFEGATLKLPLEKGAAGSGAPAASSSSTPPAAAAPAPAPAPKPAAAPAAAPAPIPIKPIPTTKEDARGENGTPKTAVNLKCDESGCIKIGASGPLVEEINIRLTGFAGGTTDGTSPYNKFSAKTEKAVKAFQRDYMGVAETGIVCGSVLRALDEFAAKYPFPLGGKIQCPCGHCSGWGNGYKESADVDYFENVVVKKDGKNVVVKNSKKHIEAPGIHRSVIWLARTILFYMATVEKDLKYSFGNIESGYRCWWRNSQKKRMSINHMGDALDIHFLKGGAPCSQADYNKIRNKLVIGHMGVKVDWAAKNVPATESFAMGATDWIHIDIRELNGPLYRTNNYYVKTEVAANGGSIIEMARREKMLSLITCGGIPPRPEPVKGGRLPVATLAPSAKIIEFLKGQEAYVLEPYHDSKTLCTIGFGHLIDGEFSCPDLRAAGNAKILEFDKGITLEKAEALMVEDLKRTEKTLQRQIKVPLYQCEYDALFSLIYNCGGIAHFPKLYTAITNAKYDECVTHFADITKGGKGLPERRQAEMEIFRHAVYKMKPIVRVKKPKV